MSSLAAQLIAFAIGEHDHPIIRKMLEPFVENQHERNSGLDERLLHEDRTQLGPRIVVGDRRVERRIATVARSSVSTNRSLFLR
jgi:hypothetical protein